YVRASANVQPGAMVDVEVVSATPRPTLALRGIVSEADAPSLSTTARLLAGIPGSVPGNSEAASLKAAAPIVTGPAIDTHRLADALKGVLVHSGVFYESHLAQWMTGHRSKEELLLEPQARLVSAPSNGESSASTNARSGHASSVSAGLIGEMQVIHPDALPVVQQQLIALDTGNVLWRGEVWNGQRLEWEIARERNARPDEDARPRWKTQLRLTLPRLGRVDATISLAPGGVELSIQANHSPAADALSADIASLSHALQESGLRVSHVEVTHATQ
ncbi:MAG TPA: flagellar hook-length control protein FliK, partial [Burkholderiales bacterium]|nr:flagellar hook-length control protein FliK [Burkholderiales bacterium]